MDEDHNQDTGFVTDEVNQVIKVILQLVNKINQIKRTQLNWSLGARNMRARKLTAG